MSLIASAINSQIFDRPFNLEFAVTMHCNLRCTQCSVWSYRTEKKEMTIDEIKQIFSSYKNFRLIGLTGGEAYTRPDFEEIIRVIVETQPHLKWLSCTSNGLTKNIPDRVKQILDDNPKMSFTQLISVDGPEPIHDKIRGVVGSWRMATGVLEELSELRTSYPNFKIGTVTVAMPWNIDVFDDVLKEVIRIRDTLSLEPSFCVWFLGQLYKNASEGEKTPNRNDFRTKLLSYIPRMQQIVNGSSYASIGRKMFYQLLEEFLCDPSHTVIPCGAAKIRYFLDPYGGVMPCTIWGKEIMNLRNVNYDLNTVFASEERHKVREAVEAEDCPVCANTCETIPSMMAQPHRTIAKYVKIKAKAFLN